LIQLFQTHVICSRYIIYHSFVTVRTLYGLRRTLHMTHRNI